MLSSTELESLLKGGSSLADSKMILTQQVCVCLCVCVCVCVCLHAVNSELLHPHS